ncbi:hypothetical protein [Bradyrhizobium guangdongense]|uniref:hypothetical protein n=2 Tax=Nitrobacteraceae TaxID=41294 RepID=UPI000551DDC6|nr:hypothetical protein [Bradyrhizobium guangdongense]MDA9422244.1 hypothetical protein [Bradyrhizobium sp. CCBAU 53380]
MSGSWKSPAAVALSLSAILAMNGRAGAVDLNGAWATSADQCDKVFTREGGKLGFTEMSEVYGGGFIVDGDQLIGKSARCKVKVRRDVGTSVNLIATCATDIMLSSVQFSVKALDANSIARLFPGMEDMEIRYNRCPMR